MKKYLSQLLIVLVLLTSLTTPAHAQTGIRFSENQASLQFPDSVTFSTHIQAPSTITSVILEYGVDQLTCGNVVAKAFPEFDPGPETQVEWTWEMRQSGSLPPGATLWWRWKVTDTSGNIATSPEQTLTWLDDIHSWQTLSGSAIQLHWYGSGDTFGRDLLNSASQALARLAQDVGLRPADPIHLYIYANTQDMRNAVLYEPSWTGGMAFPEQDIVIIGIAPADIDWGKRTVAHEITHVLVGHLTFSCLGFIPTWLVEGLAVYGEGGPDLYEQELFEHAIANDTLLSLRSISGGFSEEYERASLSYTESYSVVNYLIDTHGRSQMTALLTSLRDGATVDESLLAVYGFNIDGLEDAWRAGIGAAGRRGEVEPTPIPTPTIIPTIIPVSGIPAAPSAPTPQPNPISPAATSEAPPAPPEEVPAGPTLAERLGITPEVVIFIEIGLFCAVIGIAAILGPILLTVRRRHRRKS